MKKVSTETVYQLSVDDVKEALTLYMQSQFDIEIDIQSLREVVRVEDIGIGYDCITHFDGIKIYSKK